MTAFRCLTVAMAASLPGGQPPRWSGVMLELLPAISSPLTSETERLLVGIVRFEGRLRLTISSDMPHSMPPEDMLKSLAIQALARWTGLAYLHEMRRVQLTTPSSSLASLVRDVIQKASEDRPVPPREVAEEVAEASPLEAMKTVRRQLRKERGMSYLPGVRVRSREWEREPALSG
jgi:hypothetical protein